MIYTKPGPIPLKFYPLSWMDPGFPIGGGVDPFWRDVDLQSRHFSVKMCVKTKELGVVGGGMCRKILDVDLPMNFSPGPVKCHFEFLCLKLGLLDSSG